MRSVLGGKGRILVLRYQEQSASTTRREAGFLETIAQEFPGDIEPFSLKEPTEVSTRGLKNEVKGGQLRRKRSIASRRLFFQHSHAEPARSQQGGARQAPDPGSDDGDAFAHRLSPRLV